jgi:hypothetical protein
MLHFQQRAADLASINDRIKRIARPALMVDALKPGSVWHRHHPPHKTGIARIRLYVNQFWFIFSMSYSKESKKKINRSNKPI